MDRLKALSTASTLLALVLLESHPLVGIVLIVVAIVLNGCSDIASLVIWTSAGENE